MESDSGEPLSACHDTWPIMTSNVLEDPVWHALTGPHRVHALGSGKARLYPREMAPFSAIAETSVEAHADLAAALAPGIEARLFRPAVEVMPKGWVELTSFPMLQMVASHPPDGDASEAVILSSADTPAMLDLVAETKPGPFGRLTPSMGRYVGVRQNGVLVAMAGERLRVTGHVELSAICVRAQARGQGFAMSLTRHLMRLTFEGGEVPFLHVRPDNAAAVALYRRLGFATRRELVVSWRRPE